MHIIGVDHTGSEPVLVIDIRDREERWSMDQVLPAAVGAPAWLRERILGPDDLRTDCGEVDLIDESSGELLRTVPAPIAVLSDNGPCFRRAILAEAFPGDDLLLRHVRARVKSLS